MREIKFYCDCCGKDITDEKFERSNDLMPVILTLCDKCCFEFDTIEKEVRDKLAKFYQYSAPLIVNNRNKTIIQIK